MNTTTAVRFWVIVPAAGSSRRMGTGAVPKQYLTLAGRSVLEWAIAPFLDRAEIGAVVVVRSAEDQHWRTLALARHPKIMTTVGGAERADSVGAGLVALGDRAGERDWVLVHDAARPCLPREDLDRLMRELRDDEVGGLLAARVVDTLKRADDAGRVLETIARSALWRALTPQMFRYGLLQRALQQAAGVTDEAQAVEALGLRPRLIAGDADNIKITVPADLQRAERILRQSGAA
jgi:2-C-methyl-D-erythritol 4-phosphate cytidylyltransferase